MLYFFQILEKILPTFFFNKNGVYEKKTHVILTFIDDKFKYVTCLSLY
jgi:hypothetical protein